MCVYYLFATNHGKKLGTDFFEFFSSALEAEVQAHLLRGVHRRVAGQGHDLPALPSSGEARGRQELQRRLEWVDSAGVLSV